MSLYTCVYGTFGKLLSSGATGKSLLHKKNNEKKSSSGTVQLSCAF